MKELWSSATVYPRLWVPSLPVIPSKAMTFFGLWGLFSTHYEGPLVMLADGFYSAFYHGTNWYGPGISDSTGMLVCMTVAVVAVADELFTYMSSLSENLKQIFKKIFYFAGGLYVAGTISLSTSLNPPVSGTWESLFALPMAGLGTWVLVLLIRAIVNTKTLPGPVEEHGKAKLLAILFICISVGSTSLWLIDRFVCLVWWPIVFLFGHSLWHIGMGYAMCSGLSLVSYLRAGNFGYIPHIHFIGKFLPRVDWVRPENYPLYALGLPGFQHREEDDESVGHSSHHAWKPKIHPNVKDKEMQES